VRIVITYEKRDVLRLVQADLQARGIREKSGAPLSYRGALHVRFEVDTDDEESPAEAAPSPVRSLAAEGDGAEASPAMDEILGLSQALERSRPGLFQVRPGVLRQLAPNESHTYPKED
jgi:hypothetical protein